MIKNIFTGLFVVFVLTFTVNIQNTQAATTLTTDQLIDLLIDAGFVPKSKETIAKQANATIPLSSKYRNHTISYFDTMRIVEKIRNDLK
jgi:hypothetical protein